MNWKSFGFKEGFKVLNRIIENSFKDLNYIIYDIVR